MQSNCSSKQSDSGLSPYRLWLSLGLPLLLLLAFFGRQFINFDSIGWSDGFSHPLTGWDHLLTMLAVGIWAAQLRGQAIWMLPMAFVGVMSLGGLAGAAGLALPSVEGIILLSGAVFIVLITRKVRFSTNINVLIVAFFAFFHGFAHGQEISTSASLISYTLGFMLATLLLHGSGILVAKLVVFCVTCLLTALFSSAALAKTSASIIDVSLNVGSKSLHEISHVWNPDASTVYQEHYVAFANEAVRSESCSGCRAGVTDHPDANARFMRIGLPDFVITHPQSEDKKAPANNDGLIFKSASVQACIQWQNSVVSSLNLSSQIGLVFKNYFPDINHTPGKHLLSNGVGLTSPPVAIPTVIAPQVTHNPRKPPIPFILKNAVEPIKTPFAPSQSKGGRGFDMLTQCIGVWKPLMVRQAHHERSPHASTDFFRFIEEPNLRSIVAVFDTRKPKAHNDNNQDGVVHNLGHRPYFTVTTDPRLIRSFSNFSPLDNPSYRNSKAVSVAPWLYLPSSSLKHMPHVIPATWLLRPPLFQHKNKNP